MEFFRCNHCGNIIAFVHNSGVKVSCCGEHMTPLVAKREDAGNEKHVPVYYKEGKYLVVEVGSVAHPMVEEHYIEWVALVTKNGNQRKVLKPNSEPKVKFLIEEDDEVLELYAYCNIHGLWSNNKK